MASALLPASTCGSSLMDKLAMEESSAMTRGEVMKD